MTGIQQLLATNFSISAKDQTATILVVAGGGGGGPAGSAEALSGVILQADGSTVAPQGGRGAGGGAGGLIFLDSEFPMEAGTEYTITVGTGAFMSRKGSNSVVTGNGRTLTAIGGGAGGANDDNSNNMNKGGGSGGGAWWSSSQIGGCAEQTSLTNDGISTYDSTGFGHKGGNGNTGSPYGGGGGGSGEEGATGTTNDDKGNYGGIGKEIDILGSSGVFYAGGGASVGFNGVLQASATTAGGMHLVHGHKGGGGFGDNSVNTTAGTTLTNGVPNTGGGGGSGGNGGKGVVIIRLPNAASSTTGAPSETTVGDEIAYYFSSDGTLTI